MDNRRKSRSGRASLGRVVQKPTEFQSKIQRLNVEDFVVMTNIKDIILDEYRKEVNDIDANMSQDEETKRVLAYNTKRNDIRKWDSTGLKDLKFIDVVPEQNTTAQQQNSLATVPTPTSTLNTIDKSQLSHSEKPMEPNDFQKEILAMSYDTFINETNVKELVRKKFENAKETLTDAAMENELKKLNEQRYHFRRYHKGLLNHLKILKCECRRNKTFHDKWTQTDMVQSQDVDAQCDPVEGGLNHVTNLVQDAQSLNSCKSKLNMLTVHEITDSEIIQIECISSTVVAGT